MKTIFPTCVLIILISLNTQLQAQGARLHELYPFAGMYAPDRFQNSLTIGISYDYHFDRRFSMGGSLGFAKAGQDFFQQVGLAAPEQGTSTVIYYNGRITHSWPFGGVIPYAVAGLGVTRQHSESNLTFLLGIGTKFPIGRNTYLRYEISDQIFTSGQDDTAWTNNNLQLSLGVSFFLQ